MTIIAYSHNWTPPLFDRAFGWDNVKWARYNGFALLAIGPATVLGTGWLIDRVYLKGRNDAPMLVMIAGTLILVPTGILFPIMAEAETAFALYCVNLVGIASVTAAAPTALLNVTPGEIRGQATAVYYMAISMSGLLLGPSGVAFFTDTVFADESMIDYSISALAVVFGLPLLAALPFLRKGYIRESQAVAAREAAQAVPEPAPSS